MPASIRIDQTHPRYEEVYAQWERNNCSSQFDMIVYDDDGNAEGGVIFHVLETDGEVCFFQRASDVATDIPGPEDESKIDPGWAFASVNYRGEYTRPSREGPPKLRAERLPNKLILE